MTNHKRIKKSSLLLIIGLMILTLFLAACASGSESAETPFGLRSTALDDLVDVSNVDSSQTTGPATGALAQNPGTGAPEAESNIAAPAVNDSNEQPQIANRSEHIFDPNTAAPLSAAETEGLIYMREEEKLARDVYLALYDQWGMPVFQNIAGSEQAHMDSLLMLLDQYGLADPAAGKAPGEFADPFFQSLYEQLVGQGSLSSSDALKVGATIEELDIVDLQAQLAQTGNEYLIQVYTNLLAGSENHLRAFVSNLERQTGEIYQPLHLDQDAYQSILGGTAGQGGGNGGNGNGNGRGNGGNGNGRRNGQQGGNA